MKTFYLPIVLPSWTLGDAERGEITKKEKNEERRL
jgi:hypothetical protein